MSEKREQLFLANWENWPKELDEKAKLHKKQSYFAVDGPFDIFDNFRATLWQNREEKRSILTGALWKLEWTSAKKGVIPKNAKIDRYGHAFKIYGQKVINGELHLVAQLSNGKNIGDGGIFYFPRSVVNKEFSFGAYTFKDIDPDIIKRLNKKLSWKEKFFNWFSWF